MSLNQEYLSGNAGIAYPFADDAPGLDRGYGGFPLGLIVDALFTLPETGSPLHLLRCYVTGGRFRLVLGDVNVNDIITVTTAVPDSGSWVEATATSEAAGVRYTAALVLDAAALRKYVADIGDEIQQFQASLPFAAGTQCLDTPSLLDITLCNAGPDSGAEVITGAVLLGSGHNIAVEDYDTDPDTGIAQISIGAAAGQGLGQTPCAAAIQGAGMLAGLGVKSGELTIEGDDCYAVVTKPSLGIIQIQARCKPCCACDDYLLVAKEENRVAQVLRSVRDMLDVSLTTYEAGVAKFNNVIVPGRGKVVGDVSAMRGVETKSPNRCRLVFTIKNLRTQAVNLTSWALSMNEGAIVDDVTFEYGGTSVKSQIGGVPAGFGSIAAGRTVSITVLMHIPMPAWTEGTVWAGQASANTLEPILSKADHVIVDWRAA